VNDAFTTALNFAFEAPSLDEKPDKTPRKIGRPRKRDDIASCYRSIYPDGHEAEELSWKDAARAVGKKLGTSVSTTTLTRGLKELP
jgi:hypothetical protein